MIVFKCSDFNKNKCRRLATLLEVAGYFFNISKVFFQNLIHLWWKKCEKLENVLIYSESSQWKNTKKANILIENGSLKIFDILKVVSEMNKLYPFGCWMNEWMKRLLLFSTVTIIIE